MLASLAEAMSPSIARAKSKSGINPEFASSLSKARAACIEDFFFRRACHRVPQFSKVSALVHLQWTVSIELLRVLMRRRACNEAERVREFRLDYSTRLVGLEVELPAMRHLRRARRRAPAPPWPNPPSFLLVESVP